MAASNTHHRRGERTVGTLLRFVALAIATAFSTACAGTPKADTHLFILSGQSNMTRTLEEAFTRRVEAHYGKENVAVAMSMKSGRGIRYWVQGYRAPQGKPEKSTVSGTLYPPLLQAVNNSAAGQSFDTVCLIWMQGESDAEKDLSETYAESFLKLIHRLESDLDRDGIYFVIGRISDAGLDGPKRESWEQVRQVQVRLAEASANGAWISTDDLNGGDAANPYGGVHYPRDGAVALGERFAAKAIELMGK